MLSALIPSAGRKAAVPLAGQLPHESCVRPGPLVLGTAFLRFPTAAPDRDRHCCYRPSKLGGPGHFCSAWLCMSPCRSDHLFTGDAGVRHMASEDSGACIRCTRRYLPPPFMERATALSDSKPSAVKCSPASCARTIREKATNSCCL